jgi:hypothetical protein
MSVVLPGRVFGKRPFSVIREPWATEAIARAAAFRRWREQGSESL